MKISRRAWERGSVGAWETASRSHAKAAEDSRTPRRSRALASRRNVRQVLECGCPLPLSHAFTLIELMVVVVLIGIMTALIIPEMKGTFEDALLRSQCRDLANACQTAYSRAVTLNQVHRVRMDARGEQFYIERREREGEFVRLRDVPGSEGKLDSRISVKISKAAEEATEEPLFPTATESRAADHDETLVFYPDGTSERAEILLQDRDGFRLVLRLNPVTARVQVLELARQ